jgi:hypothetical protein
VQPSSTEPYRVEAATGPTPACASPPTNSIVSVRRGACACLSASSANPRPSSYSCAASERAAVPSPTTRRRHRSSRYDHASLHLITASSSTARATALYTAHDRERARSRLAAENRSWYWHNRHSFVPALAEPTPQPDTHVLRRACATPARPDVPTTLRNSADESGDPGCMTGAVSSPSPRLLAHTAACLRVRVPGSGHSDETLASLLALSDVMSTGHHAAVCAERSAAATQVSCAW